MCENMNSSGPLLERFPNKCIFLIDFVGSDW